VIQKLKQFGRDADGDCLICGRPSPPCRCSQEFPKLQCSIHKKTLVIEAIPVYRGQILAAWIDVCVCPLFGCTFVRAMKYQAEMRNKNRKVPS
jgi:hypothetical protein